MKINLDKVKEAISHAKRVNIPLSIAIEMVQNNIAEGFKNNIEAITEYNVGYYNALEMLYSILEDKQPQYLDLNQTMANKEAYKQQRLSSCEGFQIGFEAPYEEEEWSDDVNHYIIRKEKHTGKIISVSHEKAQKTN